ncbi:monovalent cation/H+ antiporter subunit D [Brackiella oedipodis]|uniref:monovalent cation/H+ antiporter subunit D n=1 Tax=Brackiella oedipodis TaxID=124225 RepID=UPI00048A5860|nr:monovalent cation/H+ antiporter subunit D [Brackiella oedipodis]
MSFLLNHLPVLPILIPMLAGALMLLLKEKRRTINTLLSFGSFAAQALVAFILIKSQVATSAEDATQPIYVYILGNWNAPFGIVLVVDRLTAIMLSMTACVALAAFLYSLAFWRRVGVHFYPLLQFIFMGINGAFLTGDLFNLFVFFEIFLSASYGLLLHGSGILRVNSSMHYITVNLVGASLLLIGISMIYAITGTLNLADLSLQAGNLQASDRHLFDTACSILGVAFLIKAAAWPLNFWLPSAYTAASAPVACVFALMTKVGIYALLRVGSLLVPTGAPAAFGGEWMYFIGLTTILFATFAMLNQKNVASLGAYAVIFSSGTLLTALGMPGVSLTGPSLFYMVNSVFATAAFFLLIELIKRIESFERSVLNVSLEAFGLDQQEDSDYSSTVVGVKIPAAMAFLGISFLACAMIISGVPPLAGFIGKFAILLQAMNMAEGTGPSWRAWLLIITLLIAGLASIIAFSRTGVRLFWVPDNLNKPVLTFREAGAIIFLLGLTVVMTVMADPVMTFMDHTASSLNDPSQYVEAVLGSNALEGK